MELLNLAFLSEMLNLLLDSLILTGLSCLLYYVIFRDSEHIASFAVTMAAFSMLGFVTGELMSDSREPSVSAVVPATLTLMGGAAAFVVGFRGGKAQVVVSALILNFSLALFVGADYGAAVRDEVDRDQPAAIATEEARIGVETQRLKEYVTLLKLKRDYEEKEKLDLSKFDSSYERTADPKK